MINDSCSGSCEEDPASGIVKSEYVYIILTAVTSGMSIFGGTCTCVLYFAFKDLRSPGRQLLLYLAFSDAMLALGNLLGIVWYIYGDSAVINKSDEYCDFQSAMTIYFSMTSFVWTVTMATCIFVTVVLNKQDFTTRYMKLFHVLAWMPAGIITIVALSMDVLGADTTIKQASWCWIDTRVPNVLLWQFATGKFFEIVAYITIVALYTAIKLFLMKQAKKKIRSVSKEPKRRDVIAEANRKLTFVPLVFIVCRIWGTLRFLIGNFGQEIVNEPYVTWINPLQGIGDSAQGFANFVLFCFSTQIIRRRIFPSAKNKVGDMNMSDSDARTIMAHSAVNKVSATSSALEKAANSDMETTITLSPDTTLFQGWATCSHTNPVTDDILISQNIALSKETLNESVNEKSVDGSTSIWLDNNSTIPTGNTDLLCYQTPMYDNSCLHKTSDIENITNNATSVELTCVVPGSYSVVDSTTCIPTIVVTRCSST